jgi:NADH-quinone oxidoreductase subunit D
MTDHTSTETEEERRLESQTDEGAQLLRPLTGEAREREVVLTGGPWPDADDTMIINMGPQHPSTHGVLRIMMEIDGETVLRAKAVVGYLHTSMEKTGE